MKLWMVRGGKDGRHQEEGIEQGFACIQFYEMPDMNSVSTRQEMLGLIQKTYPDASLHRAGNFAGQAFAFSHRIKEGDLIAMPLKSRPQIAVGRVTGKYQYRHDSMGPFHILPIKWMDTEIPRTRFGQDLLYSLGAFMTVCEISRHNALERFQVIINGKEDPFKTVPVPRGKDEEEEITDVEVLTDVEQLGRDQILSFLEGNFKGHELSRLVDAVLQAEGYVTHLSPPGPDGGVDILARQGSLGLDGSKLCVQVKSSHSPVDVTILRSLQGTMANFKADQGLLVSWGGFNRVAEKEARLSFFSVRLWNADDLVKAVLTNYEKLPEELQKELPLKRIWTLVTEE